MTSKHSVANSQERPQLASIAKRIAEAKRFQTGLLTTRSANGTSDELLRIAVAATDDLGWEVFGSLSVWVSDFRSKTEAAFAPMTSTARRLQRISGPIPELPPPLRGRLPRTDRIDEMNAAFNALNQILFKTRLPGPLADPSLPAEVQQAWFATADEYLSDADQVHLKGASAAIASGRTFPNLEIAYTHISSLQVPTPKPASPNRVARRSSTYEEKLSTATTAVMAYRISLERSAQLEALASQLPALEGVQNELIRRIGTAYNASVYVNDPGLRVSPDQTQIVQAAIGLEALEQWRVDHEIQDSPYALGEPVMSALVTHGSELGDLLKLVRVWGQDLQIRQTASLFATDAAPEPAFGVIQ